MFVLWLLYAEFPWTLYLYYVFDNGGVHYLVMGSEPTHCDDYLSLLHFTYYCLILYPTIGGVKLYGLCLYYAFVVLLFAERCSRA